jgi:hypothetical protein
VAEGIGTDRGLEQAVAAPLTAQCEEGTDGRRPVALLAEGREVVLADQWLGGGVHRVDVELARPGDDVAAGERVGRPAVAQPVDVPPFERGEAGVESVRCEGEVADPDVVGQQAS